MTFCAAAAGVTDLVCKFGFLHTCVPATFRPSADVNVLPFKTFDAAASPNTLALTSIETFSFAASMMYLPAELGAVNSSAETPMI